MTNGSKSIPPASLIKSGFINSFEQTNAATGFPGRQKISLFFLLKILN